MQRTVTRILLTAVILLGACSSNNSGPAEVSNGVEHLNARPQSGVTTSAAGTYDLTVSGAPNCCTLLIPQTTKSGRLPLMVMLHGAGGTPNQVSQMMALGEEFDYAVLAPKSTNASWDVLYGGFGPDVVRINNALVETFKKVNVDPAHIVLAGFSDGASYALSLGLANGDLFSHVIAFSPGFISAVPLNGKPKFFVVHGLTDGVLSYDHTKNVFVPFLQRLGYAVQFDSFQGGHTVDDTEARKASQWFLQ